MTEKSYEDARDLENREGVLYGYDVTGQRVSMMDRSGESRYEYDGLGRITKVKPSEFHKLTRKVCRFLTEEKTAAYGLENAYGYGRALAVWLIEKGCMVKDVNTALSYA